MICVFVIRLLGILPEKWDEEENVTGELADSEYIGARKVAMYMCKAFNIIDAVTIVGGFLAFGTQSRQGRYFVLEILRLTRVFRILRITGMARGRGLFFSTIKRSRSAVRVMFFFSLLAAFIFGSIMYHLEAGNYEVSEAFPDGAYVRWDYVHAVKVESPYKSILHSMYWAVVTTTTTGYGDFYPTSAWGRVAACVYLYFGIVMLALPISVVGTNFQREYAARYPDRMEEERVRRLASTVLSPMQQAPSFSESRDVAAGDTTSNVQSTSYVKNLEDRLSEMDIKLEFLLNEMRELRKSIKNTSQEPTISSSSE